MQDHSNIPYGFCHCGCGEKTSMSHRTSKTEHVIKGQPNIYVRGHANRHRHFTHSLRCYGPGRPVAERFWEKVNKNGPIPLHYPELGACWIWTGSIKGTGRGSIRTPGKRWIASRFAYLLHHGAIPEGMDVCHNCDNPSCCRPDHLFLGTHAQNMADMRSKHRENPGFQQGSTHPLSKLSEWQVQQIRTRYADGNTSMVKLAKEFGVGSGSICKIIHRDQWKHLP